MTAGPYELDPIACFDPKRLIREAVTLPEPAPTTARDCLLLWLMSLPEEVDPAEAAAHLLQTVLATAPPPRTALTEGLARELAEVTRFPRRQLETGARPTRRRRRSS